MVDKKAVAETCKDISGACKQAGILFHGYAYGFLAIPTIVRKGENVPGAFMIGEALGALSLVSTIIPLSIYNPRLALYAAATNIASGLYELYRYNKNKLAAPSVPPAVSSSSTEPEKKDGLEKIAGASPEEYNFTDPWKVKIPEIERRKEK